MRVALFIDHLGAGGAQRQIVGLAGMLKERGVEVKVYTYYPNMFYGDLLSQHGVTCEVIEGATGLWRRLVRTRKTLLRAHADVVVAYLDSPSMLACLARRTGGKFKLIVSERNTTQVLTRRERVKFWLYRVADFIVPNSYAQGEFIGAHFPQYRPKTKVIPNFVDLGKFAFHGQRHRRPKAVILVVASVWASKNTKGLIEAVRELRSRRDDFIVKWFGLIPDTPILRNREYMAECQRLVSDRGLDDCFFLYPKTQSIDEEYRQADFFCLPSFYEGTPNVLCEAMASALPVVCSRVCDNPHYVCEGENGFLFDPHDPNDMALKLEAALNLDGQAYAEYSGRSRQIAEREMSEDRFVGQYMALF